MWKERELKVRTENGRTPLACLLLVACRIGNLQSIIYGPYPCTFPGTFVLMLMSVLAVAVAVAVVAAAAVAMAAGVAVAVAAGAGQSTSLYRDL